MRLSSGSRVKSPAVLISAGLLTIAPPTLAQNYTFVNVADSSGPLSNFVPPSINSAGTIAFWAGLDAGGSAVSTGNGGATTPIADTTGQFVGLFGRPCINDGGDVVFLANLSVGGTGIFLGNGGPTVPVADSAGPFSTGFNDPSMNAAGAVAFYAGFDAGGSGIHTGSGGPGPTAPIALTSGPFQAFTSLSAAINAGGTVAFRAFLDTGERGIFTVSSGGTSTIADDAGPFADFGHPAINYAGEILFQASLDVGGSGLYLLDRAGNFGPIVDDTGPYASFGSDPAINGHGRIAFLADLDAGGTGIFTGPDPTTDTVIKTGDALFGSTLVALDFNDALNDHGDIAFEYELASGVTGVAIAKAPAPTFTFTNIIDTTAGFQSFGPPTVNNNGVVAFMAVVTFFTDVGIYTMDAGVLTTIADAAGPFNPFFGHPSISDSGAVVFHAELDAGGRGIFTGAGPASPIADDAGQFSGFGRPDVDPGNVIAFSAALDNGTGGLYRHHLGVLTPLYDSAGPFDTSFGDPSINHAGVVAFRATLDGGGRGVFRGDGGPVTTIVDNTSPGSPFVDFSGASLNAGGTAVAFKGALAAGGEGVYFGSGGPLTTVADDPSIYGRIPDAAITAPGTAAVFYAQFRAGNDGILIGSGGEVDPIIQVGDTLFGSTVISMSFSRGLNDRGQIAFTYRLANGVAGIALATPSAAPAICICEVDGVSPVDVFDLLSYLNEWFNNTPAADIDGVPGVDVFDLLFFLNCWFPASAGAPCP